MHVTSENTGPGKLPREMFRERVDSLSAHDPVEACLRGDFDDTDDLAGAFGPETLIGQSETFAAVRSTASAVARRHCTVMILGETGTGKEMVAHYLHAQSPRARRPFIPVDCSALTDTLFESELFGHVRGAFTGAVRDTLGFIRAAHGGTLFLDEIGELSAPLQAKLLRVIQERRVVPVGGTQAHAVDVRIVTATHRNLADMVQRGDFRQDLYYRLNVVTLNLPPLRERGADILPLAEHFLRLQAELYGEPRRQLTAEAAALLKSHGWPGNVRELANVMERAHVLAQGPDIEVWDLPAHLHSGVSAAGGTGALRLDVVQREVIAQVLRQTHCNKAAASRLLGVNVQRLNRLITRLHVPMPRRSE